METRTFLDTHVVILLAAGKTGAISKAAARTIDRAEWLCVSPLVGLEMQFLWEIRRIPAAPASLLRQVARDLGVGVCEAALGELSEAAAALGWTRDPFDRLIVAQAALLEAPLVTKDETILAHYPRAVW